MLRSRSFMRFTMRVGLPHLGQSVLLLVSMTFLRWGGLHWAGSPVREKTKNITAYLVDWACPANKASHRGPGFAAKHDKGCRQMEECAQSGYPILPDDNKIIKLDKQSNETAKKLIAD